MKLVMSERTKHRLTGLVVILSVAIIFLPAMLKNSNKRFEDNVSISLRLPKKPKPPVVAIPNQQTMFQTVKVAHVDIPTMPVVRPVTQIARAMPLQRKVQAQQTRVAKVVLPAVPVNKTTIVGTQNSKVKVVAVKKPNPATIVSKTLSSNNKSAFAIQLASFAEKNNAKSLVARLQSSGYVASYSTIHNKQGEFYKVIVGQLSQRQEALNLQKKLADNMQLKGFIVKTG